MVLQMEWISRGSSRKSTTPGTVLAAVVLLALLANLFGNGFVALPGSYPRTAQAPQATKVHFLGKGVEASGFAAASAFGLLLTASQLVGLARKSPSQRRFQDERASSYDPEGAAEMKELQEHLKGVIEAQFQNRDVSAGTPGSLAAASKLSALAVARSGRRLNSEFANGRLLLQLASMDATAARGHTSSFALNRSKVVRYATARAGDEEAAESTTDQRVEVEKKDYRAELPSDAGYGWDPDDIELDEFFDASKEIGVTAPLGFFDPLGVVKKEPYGDAREEFLRLRACEIKHGRICMLASIGAVVQHWVRLPGYEATRNGSFISQFDTCFAFPGIYGFLAMTVGMLTFETALWRQLEEREPGNMGDPAGFQALGFGEYNTEWRNREINNGRFAMFAVVGILVAQNETGLDAAQQLGFN
eukprot:TRINITY_DN83877_c0_g1_i1.p1 TRINITY_DN83877_c0_g1~~TRINITY_DN83877_c0_g1_i1.p1  ORF type:complete len:418 (-),score=83.17 TRINITY_DN83877_c0_g1_i1:76-1329(-)